jgi:predicted  nucleic acid-binding Zn-ribbon protein
MHKRNRGALDDKLLELMEAIDQAQKRVDEKSNALKQVEVKRTGDLAQLTDEQHALVTRLSELDAEREKTRAALPADLLRTYDQLYRTKAGRAVAQLKRDACGACGMSIPTGLINRLRAGEEIIFCSSCGRILAP